MKDECCEETTARLIRLPDCGREMQAYNKGLLAVKKIRYDGCEVSNVPAVDYILRIENVVDYLFELKGKNLEHALDQIISTVERMTISGDIMDSVFAAVYCKQFPSASRGVLKRREELKKKYKVDVEISTSKYIYCLENRRFIAAAK